MEVIGICALGVISAVLFFFYGKISALVDSDTVRKVEAFAKYKPYAMMAATKVESMIADDLGLAPDASTVDKSLRKLDAYLRTFIQLVNMQEGEAPSKELLDEAKKWSVELAERLNYKKVEEATSADTVPAT